LKNFNKNKLGKHHATKKIVLKFLMKKYFDSMSSGQLIFLIIQLRSYPKVLLNN